jgi:lipid II:glycine glycyltransferase (peptidoglycan interpeptide bridge formation enzyme)
MTDIRQSPQWGKYLTNLGWIVERIDNTNYAIKKIPLLGAILKIQRPNKYSSKTVQKLCKKYHARIFTGLSLPTKTIQIDLTKPEKQLLAEMHYKTRYNIAKLKTKNLKLKISNDIESFVGLYHRWHRKRLLFLSQAKLIRSVYKAFGKKADLLFCVNNQEVIAELLLLTYDRITYYMYAAASETGKRLFAPTLITWEAIKLAKNQGSKIFDFEGVYDERYPIKSWRGFTRFKKSFGGYEVLYPITK